jgi:hypothetical protein
MRNLPIRVASLLLLLGIPASGTGAQQLRGVVTDGAAGTPVAGAVVMPLDASGGSLARTISNPNGEYAALRFEAKRDSVSQLRLLVPSTDQYVFPHCDGRSWPPPDRRPGMLQVAHEVKVPPSPT